MPRYGTDVDLSKLNIAGNRFLQFGCIGDIISNDTSYLAPGNGKAQKNEVAVRVPVAGRLKNFYVQHREASGKAGRTDIYTIRINSVNTSLTCTLDNQTQGQDTVHEVAVVAGDSVSVMLVSNSAADKSADVTAIVEVV